MSRWENEGVSGHVVLKSREYAPTSTSRWTAGEVGGIAAESPIFAWGGLP